MSEPLKTAQDEIWFFDTETVPCVATGRKVYGLLEEEADSDVRDHMYEVGGATDVNPKPMLKTVLQRVVAISAVVRKSDRTSGAVELSIHSLPVEDDFDERRMVERFLQQLGARKPQVVGYNQSGFDIPTLFQRAIVHGIDISNFCQRPEKPWDRMPDYFSDLNAWNVDLLRVIGGWGKAKPSLAEVARACGIPAKIGGDGSQVTEMWLAGKHREIVNYCESDALSTYLLWLRIARSCGLLTAGSELFSEEDILRQVLFEARSEKPHLGEFLDQWEMNEIAMEVAA